MGGGWNSITDNPIGRSIFGDPSKGYETAAQGAGAAATGYGDLAGWNWGQAMGALGQAQDSYGKSNATWDQMWNKSSSNPLDQWWQQNQGQFGQPTATSGALGQYQDYMGQNSKATDAYSMAQRNLMSHPSAGAEYGQRFGSQMSGQQSQQEMAYNPSNYANPGAAESFYGQAQGMLGGPGRAENLQYQGTNNMGSFAAGLAGQQGAGATTMGAPEIGGYYRGANDTSQYAQGQMGQLSGPGAYEQFVQSDINGTNPQIQRETDQGLARINQEAARRGGFKSGGADTSIGNFLGSQAAADYQNRAQRAQSAQGMQLNRIGAGQSLSQASAQGELAQGSALQSLAGQMDAEKMGRLQQQMGAQQGASTEGLANSSQRLNYAQAGDQAAIARAQALGGFANSAQANEMARLQGGMNAAGQSDQGYMSRMKAGFDMSQGADQSEMARYMGLNSMAQGADQGNLARYSQLGQMSGQQDQQTLARLMGAGGMAGNVAAQDQKQMMDLYNSRFGLDQANSGNIRDFYGMGMQGFNENMGNSYNALANYYQLLGTGQSANAAMPMQLANMGVQGYKAAHGGGGGG